MTNEFFDRLRLPGAVIQVGGLDAVDHAIAHDQPFDFESYANANPDRDLYFLAGVKPGVTGRAGDHDIAIKNYLVFDFDIRSFEKKNNRQIDDTQLRGIAERILQSLDNHKLLKTYSYAVLSGNGLHVYFIGKAIQVSDIFLFKAGMRQYIDHINQVSPMPADKACINPGRIIRIPGSVNQKNGFKTNFIRNEYKESPLTSGIIRLGQERIRLLEEEAKIAVKEKIEFTAPDSCNSVYEAINQIPIQDLVCAEFGWEYKNRHFYGTGERKEKACFVASDGNHILHGGTDHFSDQQVGYSPFQFVRMLKNLDNRNTFLWFENNFPDIYNLAEEKRKEYQKKIKANDPKYRIKKDKLEWIFRPKELTIREAHTNSIIYKAKFGAFRFWETAKNQDLIAKKLAGVCDYYKRKEATKIVNEITLELSKKWKNPLTSMVKKSIRSQKIEELVKSNSIDYALIHEISSQIGIFPPDMLDLTLAHVISAQRRSKPPLWIMYVGTPSSCKTEIAELTDETHGSFTYYVDTITENAFASGYIPADGSEPKDLLPYLDNKCFIVKDYTTLFSLNEETVKKILGDLTSIFDQSFKKFTPTRGEISYKVAFSQIGCITPAIIYKHNRYMNMLGARFLFYRVPELNESDISKGFEIAWSDNREELLEKTKIAVCAYLINIIKKLPDIKYKKETPDIRKKINDLSQFIAKARSDIISKPSAFIDDKGKEVKFIEIISKQQEQPWRIFRQLKELGRCLAIVRGKEETTDEEIKTLRTIAIHSMPLDRSIVIEKMIPLFSRYGVLSRQCAQKESGLNYKKIERAFKELSEIGIMDSFVEKNERTGKQEGPRQYIPAADFQWIIGECDYVVPTEDEYLEKSGLLEIFNPDEPWESEPTDYLDPDPYGMHDYT